MATARPVTEGSVVITPRGVERLRSGHLWVYRSDVRSAPAEPGAVVRLTDERGNFCGRAFYSDKSQISIRLLTREDVPIDRAFFAARFRRAAAYRDLVVENSDACRLVYSEADLLPSVIVDRYGDYLVLQTLSQSSDRLKCLFVEILVELFSPKGVVERNDPKVRMLEGLDQRVSVLHGEVPPEVLVKENGVTFSAISPRGRRPAPFSTSAKTTGPRGDMPPETFSIASAIRADSRSRSRTSARTSRGLTWHPPRSRRPGEISS